MKKILCAALISVCPLFAKGKISEARKLDKRMLSPGSVKKIYGSLDDKNLIPEMADLEIRDKSMDSLEKEILLRYGMEREFVERSRKNSAFANHLVEILDSNSATPRMKRSIAKNIWKIRKDPALLDQDEASLRRYYRGNVGDKDARLSAIRNINSTSDANVDFLVDVSEKTDDPDELRITVNRLGKMGSKADREKRGKTSARIREHLVKLRNEKRIGLAHLSGTQAFADNREGRDYVTDELEKSGFADWELVLHPIQDSLDMETIRKVYRHEMAGSAGESKREGLGRLVRGRLGKFPVNRGFADKNSKLEFLDLYGLGNGQGSEAPTDAAVSGLLADPDDDVRYAAVVAAHLGLKNNFGALSGLYKTETNPKIKKFLHTYGYGE
jgi:hypothetical protein